MKKETKKVKLIIGEVLSIVEDLGLECYELYASVEQVPS